MTDVESLVSYPFISCGEKGYWVTGIDSARRRLWMFTYHIEASHLSSWMHQTSKTTWVTELFHKAGMLFAFTPQEWRTRPVEQLMKC